MAAETIAQAISGIRRTFPNMDGLSEEDVKLWVIERILAALDWNSFDPGEMKKEYTVGKDKVDYALNPDSPTAVFVEAKKPAVTLDNHEHQLLKYCFQQAVNLAVLTNGRTWRLYLPQYQGPQGEGLHWSEKRFSEIDITSGGTAKIQKEFERFLTKGKVSSGGAVEAGKVVINIGINDTIVKKGMVETWNNVLTTPSEDLIKLFTESTAGVCGSKPTKQQVREFFQNHRVQFKVSGIGHSRPKPATNGVGGGQNGKPSRFRFNDKPYLVGTWKEVLVKLCELIYVEKQDEFDQVMNVRGTKTLYFSRNRDDLSKPEPIGNSGIFAATAPLAALEVEKRCRRVLRAFDYPKDCFEIE